MSELPAGRRAAGGRCLVRLATLGLAALTLTPAAAARECEVGNRPGSTLLFPYFEVDLTDPLGLTTLISINSASSEATLARVVVWTDWAIPAMSFDLFLRPHDVQTINLRDVMRGVLPTTSGPETLGFASCSDNPPSYSLSESEVTRLRARLTGFGDTTTSGCMASRYGDDHARGYITVDTSDRCAGLILDHYFWSDGSPAAPDYFTTIAIVDNVLWGDMFYVDPAENSAQGVEAVAIRAGAQTGAHPNTFYGRFVAWNGSDQRAPLPSIWSSRFARGGAFSGGTEFIVFRDPRVVSQAFSCSPPSWYPLFAEAATFRDEAGTATSALRANGVFGLATQKIDISALAQNGGVPEFGQVLLDLGKPDGSNAGAWVIPIMTASGRFSVDFNAQPIDSTCGD